MSTGSSRRSAAEAARAAHSRIASYSIRRRLSDASSSMSATASGESRSCSLPSAASRRARACVWRPSSRSTPAQATVTRARVASASSGTSSAHSIRMAWLSSKRPLAASTAAYVSSSSTRSSAGVVSGVSRTAAANQRAALAGARWAAAAPASRSVAIAAGSPWRAARSTWWARAEADAPRVRKASALRSCAPSRQPPGVAS